MKDIDFKKIKVPLIILTLVWLPVLLAQRYYMDDLGRSVRGYYEWSPNGRPVADAIFKLFNSGGGVLDYSPAYQLLALVVMSLSCLLFLYTLGLKFNKRNLIASSLLFVTPLYLENFTYRYDALTMSISCLLAILSFELSKNFKDKRLFGLGILAGLLYLSTYQTFLSVFIILTALNSLRFDKFKSAVMSVLAPMVSLIVYYLLYSKFISAHYVTGEYNLTHSKISIDPANFIYNAKNLILFATGYLKCLPGYLMLGIAGFSMIAIILRTFSKAETSVKVWRMLIIIGLCISPIVIYLPLQSPVYYPRVYVGLGAALAGLLLFSGLMEKFPKLIMLVLAAYFFSMLMLSSAYKTAANTLYSQENVATEQMMQTINAYPNKQVLVFGSFEKPVVTQRIADKIKLIDYMTPIYINNENWWGKLQLNMAGMDRVYITDKPERNRIKALMCAKKMQSKGNYIIENTLIFNLQILKC